MDDGILGLYLLYDKIIRGASGIIWASAEEIMRKYQTKYNSKRISWHFNSYGLPDIR
jgi:hypothetical protein